MVVYRLAYLRRQIGKMLAVCAHGTVAYPYSLSFLYLIIKIIPAVYLGLWQGNQLEPLSQLTVCRVLQITEELLSVYWF